MKIAVFLVCLLFIGCTSIRPDAASCAKDSKVCPDGTVVVREGTDCEFPLCLVPVDAACDYGSPMRDYKGQSPELCMRIKKVLGRNPCPSVARIEALPRPLGAR